MKVERFMRQGPTISPRAPILEAESLCRTLNVKILAVTEHGRLEGVVTRGDIARALPSEATTLAKNEMRAWLDEVLVEEFMKEPLVLSTGTDILDAASLAARSGIYNFPVVEGGKLVGMLYEEDLFRCLIEEVSRPALRIEVSLAAKLQDTGRQLQGAGKGGAT